MRNPLWAKGELDFIFEHQSEPLEWLARQVGRSAEAVERKISRLNAKAGMSPAEIAFDDMEADAKKPDPRVLVCQEFLEELMKHHPLGAGERAMKPSRSLPIRIAPVDRASYIGSPTAMCSGG